MIDTFAWYVAAYVAAGVIYVGYAVSLWLRWRKAVMGSG